MKCERVWDSLRALVAGVKTVRGGALSAVGYACVPCARSKNEYFLRLARAATADRRRGSLPEQQGGSAETTTLI